MGILTVTVPRELPPEVARRIAERFWETRQKEIIKANPKWDLEDLKKWVITEEILKAQHQYSAALSLVTDLSEVK